MGRNAPSLLRRIGLTALIAWSLATVACGGSMVAGRAMATGPSGHFIVRNVSEYTICFVYMSPSNYNSWGPDWLARRETIEPSVQRTFELNIGTYDIRFDDCQRQTLLQRWRVAIRDGDTLEFRSAEAPRPR